MNRYFKKYFNDKLIFLLIFLFITSRILYYYLGIRFEFFQSYWQILPLDLLKNDLLKTLFFNFSQPPLLNFLLGVGLKIGNHILFLHLFFMIMGLIAFINFYKILLYFTSYKFSFFLTLILMIMPLTILWENHGYKDYLTMCFLINCIFYSLKIIDKNYYKQYFFLSINLILISILRETFHYFWVLIFVLFEFLMNKRLKKTIFLFLITAFFILPFYIKNLIIFNKFQIAGWMYENLTQKTLYIQQMKNGEHLLLKKLIFKDDFYFNNFISQLSDLQGNTFQSPSYYIDKLGYKYKYQHPLLQSETFHNEVMLEVDEIRKKDFYLYLKKYPEVFVITVFNSLFRHYFNSSENFLFLDNNVKKIPKLVKLSHCIKLTILCLNHSDDQNYSRKSYAFFTVKDKIFFSLQQTNFLVFFIYLFAIYQFLKFFFNYKKKNIYNKNFNFWFLTILFMLLVLLLFEDTEIPRHRFPYEYLMILFSIFYFQKNKKVK
jgi:hypothetical protein